MKHSRPEDLFRAEKERATTARNSQHARLLAEAKAAFDKLMAEGQAARKSGRPRKHPLPPLKTTSSRTPPRPPAAPTPAAPTPVVTKPAAPAATPSAPKAAAARPVVAKNEKPDAKGTVKRTAAPRRGAKSEGKSAPARGATQKGKPKGSARR